MNKNFLTIKFVCDKENEKEILAKIKRDLPIMLIIASKNELWSGPTYADPFLEENTNKIGYIIRLNKKIVSTKKADIQAYDFVFKRRDIIERIKKLRKKYKIKKINGCESFDASFAFEHIDDFVNDAREICFNELKLNGNIWNDFFYFILDNTVKNDKFRLEPSVKAVSIAKIENRIIEYKIELAEDTTKSDVINQYSAFASLAQEFSPIIHKRTKKVMELYKKANNTVLMKKDVKVYIDPATGEEIIQDTTIEDQIIEVFGENQDDDNLKQIDRLRKIKERSKKFGQ